MTLEEAKGFLTQGVTPLDLLRHCKRYPNLTNASKMHDFKNTIFIVMFNAGTYWYNAMSSFNKWSHDT